MERSKTVAFCTSCHVMERYGHSLHVDDDRATSPAQHYQYNRVPRETACFACHTNYTMYGDYKAKLRGLRHVWVQYIGTIPEKIALYTPYNNRECLHCHDGARSFVEAVTHKGEMAAHAPSNANRPVLTKGCHGTVHDVADTSTRWPLWPKGGASDDARRCSKRRLRVSAGAGDGRARRRDRAASTGTTRRRSSSSS